MTGSPDTGQRDHSGKWRIDRFELIYYNARHKRWQYFAEDPLISFSDNKNHRDGESPHRRQVRRFLFMVRGAIELLVSTLNAESFEVRPRQGADPKSPLAILRPSFAGWQRSWDEYLSYLHYSAQYAERLPMTDLDALSNCFYDLQASGSGVHSLSRSLSITLLSLLPILEEWDTWGCFLRARRAAIQELSATMHFPATCSGADWFEPFYIAEVEYTGRSGGTVSAELLGEVVNLEAGSCDLSNSQSKFKRSQRADFFEYCKRPEEHAGELYLYRCYGHFVDALIKGLSGEGDARRYFFVAYPLQAAGRLHFLQIALTTTDPAASVDALQRDWSIIHEHFWQPECRAMLAAEQERIALSAFQHAAASRLREIARPGAKLTDEDLQSVLAENVYCLFPIRVAKTRNASWHYIPYEYEETPQSGGGILRSGIRDCVLGYRWKTKGKGSTQYAGTAKKNLIEFKADSYGIEGKAPRIGNHVLQNTLIGQRIVQSIEQQMDYLKSMRHAIEQERRIEEDEIRRAGIILAQFLEGLSQDSSRRILRAVSLDEVQDILSVEVESGRYGIDDPGVPSDFTDRPRQAIRYLHQAHRAVNSAVKLQILQHALQPSLLEDLSHFFDSSLVKIYTHTCEVSDYFAGTLNDAKQAVSQAGSLGKLSANLYRRLAHVDQPTASRFQEAFVAFARVVQTLSRLQDLEHWESKHKPEVAANTIGTLRRRLSCFRAPAIEESGVGPEVKRFFLHWNLWLKLWLDAYRQRRHIDAAQLRPGPHIVRTPAQFVGEKFPLTGNSPILLYDNSWWFPCSVGTDLALHDKANTVISWTTACQECASLFLVNCTPEGRIVLIREAVHAESEGLHLDKHASLVDLGTAARSRPVLTEHFALLPKTNDLNHWVILYRTWMANEETEAI